MDTIERAQTINAPVDKVFAYLADPKANPEWLPGMVEVKHVKVTKKGIGTTHRWVYKMAGMQFRGENVTTEFVPNERLVNESKGDIESIWTWVFEPTEDGTKLSLAVDYNIPPGVLAKLTQPFVLKQNRREAVLAMANIKAKMEDQAPETSG